MLSTFGTQLSSPSCILVLFMIHVKKKKNSMQTLDIELRLRPTSFFVMFSYLLLLWTIFRIPSTKRNKRNLKGKKKKENKTKKLHLDQYLWIPENQGEEKYKLWITMYAECISIYYGKNVIRVISVAAKHGTKLRMRLRTSMFRHLHRRWIIWYNYWVHFFKTLSFWDHRWVGRVSLSNRISF